jgi:hypothetical protein
VEVKMDEELVKRFEREFEKLKKELGFRPSLEQLDDIFYFRDFIQKEGYIGTKLSRMLSGRIVSTYGMWEGYLHSLLMPNPNNMPNIEESKLMDEAERKEILKQMTKLRAFVTKNAVIGLTDDRKAEAEFFNEAVELWDKEFKAYLTKLMKKVNEGWVKNLRDIDVEDPRQKKDQNYF